MATNFVLPKHRATDINGTPIRGARLAFYRSGTDIPLATFADEELTVPNPHPVVSDGDGWFGAIYLQPLPYRVALLTASGMLIWSTDNVRAVFLHGAGILERVRQIAANPLDFGAQGNGDADEHKAVQAAVDAATGVVDLLGKTYRCAYGITLRSGITIRNGTLDFSGCRDDFALSVTGQLQSRQLLAENAEAGGTTLKVSALSGIVAGDLIMLSSGATCELLRVAAVSADTITVVGKINGAYNTSHLAAISRVAAASQVSFENLTIIGSRKAVGKLCILDAQFVDGLSVRNCVIQSYKTAAVSLVSCANAVIAATAFRHGSDTASAIEIRGASQGAVIGPGCAFVDAGTGVRVWRDQTGSVTRDVFVTACFFVGCRVAGVSVEKSQNVTVAGCQFDAPKDAVGARLDSADDVIVFGSLFRGAGDGIALVNSSARFSHFGNTYSCGGHSVDGDNIAATLAVSGSTGKHAFYANGTSLFGGPVEVRGTTKDQAILNITGTCHPEGSGVKSSMAGGTALDGQSVGGKGVRGTSELGIGGEFGSKMGYGLVVSGNGTLRLVPQAGQAAPLTLSDGVIWIAGDTLFVRLNGATRRVNVT